MVPGSRPAPRRLALTPRLRDALIVLACLAAQAAYLLTAQAAHGRFGFPLDDAWIHQTYARNLIQTGQWAFVPGMPSAGSTSILWTVLLAPGHWLPLDPRWWTQGVGLLALVGAALGAARLAAHLAAGPGQRLALAAGLAVALEWHLVWAAASGMETGLFAALLIWFWLWVLRRSPERAGHHGRDGLLLGIWGGVLMLVRPEGVLAVGLVGLAGLLRRGRLPDRLRWAALAALGFALASLPFWALNLAASGTLFPNTFYAKQTEYAALWARPYLARLFEQAAVSFVGAQVLLLPGLLAWVWQQARRARSLPAPLLPLAWAVLHWALYAARLPVTYQHGRYAIPTIPLIVVFGLVGMVSIAKPRDQRPLIRAISLAWLLTAALLVVLVPAALGAPAYGRDVAFIEQEMVETARWVAAHTPPAALIAAHDIGALGYFAPRPLVDLAGLVSPEVIPFMTDGDRLAAYIVENRAEYLIVFPGWSAEYARLVQRPEFEAVWSADRQAGYVDYAGLGPLTVYRVQAGE